LLRLLLLRLTLLLLRLALLLLLLPAILLTLIAVLAVLMPVAALLRAGESGCAQHDRQTQGRRRSQMLQIYAAHEYSFLEN
jgi:hypothetical protein